MIRQEVYRLTVTRRSGIPTEVRLSTKSDLHYSIHVTGEFLIALDRMIGELRRHERRLHEPKIPPLSKRTRGEHIKWCKWRANEYLDDMDYKNAVTSMLSDLSKHPETQHLVRGMGMIGMFHTNTHDEVKRFIEGFAE
jgi:hypothetical protein